MTLSSILVPSSGCLLGVYPGSSCDTGTASFAARCRNHEALIGRSPTTGGVLGIVSAYHDFNDYAATFPTADEQSLSDEGRLLMLHWTPRIFNTSTQYKWADIAAGVYDSSIIIPQAKLMRDWGRRFFISFHNEMNASSSDDPSPIASPYGSDADYANAARHIHDVFVAQGATNAVWVFKPSGYTATLSRMNALYPGDLHADWVGFDPYGDNTSSETVAQVLTTKYPMVGWAGGTDPNYRKTTIPTNITVTPQGVTGATTYSYKLTSVNAAGETVASGAVQITNGNATLSGSNFNRVAWTVSSGATSTKVYGRSAGSWLLIATVNAPTAQYDDTGAVSPSGAPPSVGAIGDLTKPLMMAEWGKKEVSGSAGAKAQFFSDMAATLKATPNSIIKAAVYFNSVSGSSECLNTSTTTLNGYKTLAADLFFNPDVSPAGPPVAQGAYRASASAAFVNTNSKQIVYPIAAQAGDGALLCHTSTRTGLKNACEGTNAANVTTGNSNTAGSTPFDSLGAVIPVYDTAQKHSGSSSILYSLTAQTVTRTTWEASFPAQQANVPYYGRTYIYPTAAPSTHARFFQQNTAGGGTTQWGVAVDTTGKIIVRNISGAATVWTSTVTPATSAFHRIEWKCLWNGSTTTVDVRIYSGANLDTTTLSDSGTSTAFTQAAAGGQYNFGLQGSSMTYSMRQDDFGLALDTWMGPVGTSAVLTDPTGWTLVDSRLLANGAGEMNSRWYRRTTAAGDPGSTITLQTTDGAGNAVNAHGSIILLVYSGVDQLALVDVDASSTKNADSTTVVTPNVTTTANNEWIVSAAFVRDNPGGLTSSWTLPGGEGQRAATFPSGTSDGRVAGVASDDGTAHSISTYGTKTFTANATSYLGIGWTVAVKSTGVVSSGQSLGFMSQHN